MTILTIAVCEEKKEDSYRLKEQLARLLPTAEVCIFENGEKLLEALKEEEHSYGLIFLGLKEPALAGMKTAEKIRACRIFTPIIFLSETETYYREAFEVFAFQYIMKPYTEESLEQALYPLICEQEKTGKKTVHFWYRSQLYSIRQNRIAYISSNLHNVCFHLENGKLLSCRGKLGDFEEQLKDSFFIRCHQSFYVNMEKVISMKNEGFVMKDAIVPISRSCAREAKQRYTEFVEKNGK